MQRTEPQTFGIPPDPNIRYGMRIYVWSMIFAVFAIAQWLIIGHFIDMHSYQGSQVRYGYWLMGTCFAICVLSCTKIGRKMPVNALCIFIIVETSILYIAAEQQVNKGKLINFYACCVVISLVIASIIWGAYFPMRLVPGDLMLSLLLASGNIMLFIFFINAYFIDSETIYIYVRNFFALLAITMIMYTATIIHDRQFDVPKNETQFLSVLIFVGHMILHERILALNPARYRVGLC